MLYGNSMGQVRVRTDESFMQYVLVKHGHLCMKAHCSSETVWFVEFRRKLGKYLAVFVFYLINGSVR